MLTSSGQKFIHHNEFLRLKAQELTLLLKQARELVLDHNPTIGSIAEEIVRGYLNGILPNRFKATQGFAEHKGSLSPQCDIIIYDRLNYSPLYSFGNIEIIPSTAIVSIIEIKTGITAQRFCEQLRHIEKTHNFGISRCHLIIFQGPRLKSLQNWFYNANAPAVKRFSEKNISKDSMFITSDNRTYDVDDYELLPESILILDKGACMIKDLVQDSHNDYWGYTAYSIIDNENKEICGLQIFTEQILNDLESTSNPQAQFPPLLTEESDTTSTDSLKRLTISHAFPICPI